MNVSTNPAADDLAVPSCGWLRSLCVRGGQMCQWSEAVSAGVNM